VRYFGRSLEIDAREAGGPLRLANRGSNPNADPEHLAVKGKWTVVFIARHCIASGEEITVGYGEAYGFGGEKELIA
jgi:SET domain-containing protein